MEKRVFAVVVILILAAAWFASTIPLASDSLTGFATRLPQGAASLSGQGSGQQNAQGGWVDKFFTHDIIRVDVLNKYLTKGRNALRNYRDFFNKFKNVRDYFRCSEIEHLEQFFETLRVLFGMYAREQGWAYTPQIEMIQNELNDLHQGFEDLLNDHCRPPGTRSFDIMKVVDSFREKELGMESYIRLIDTILTNAQNTPGYQTYTNPGFEIIPTCADPVATWGTQPSLPYIHSPPCNWQTLPVYIFFGGACGATITLAPGAISLYMGGATTVESSNIISMAAYLNRVRQLSQAAGIIVITQESGILQQVNSEISNPANQQNFQNQNQPTPTNNPCTNNAQTGGPLRTVAPSPVAVMTGADTSATPSLPCDHHFEQDPMQLQVIGRYGIDGPPTVGGFTERQITWDVVIRIPYTIVSSVDMPLDDHATPPILTGFGLPPPSGTNVYFRPDSLPGGACVYGVNSCDFNGQVQVTGPTSNAVQTGCQSMRVFVRFKTPCGSSWAHWDLACNPNDLDHPTVAGPITGGPATSGIIITTHTAGGGIEPTPTTGGTTPCTYSNNACVQTPGQTCPPGQTCQGNQNTCGCQPCPTNCRDNCSPTNCDDNNPETEDACAPFFGGTCPTGCIRKECTHSAKTIPH